MVDTACRKDAYTPVTSRCLITSWGTLTRHDVAAPRALLTATGTWNGAYARQAPNTANCVAPVNTANDDVVAHPRTSADAPTSASVRPSRVCASVRIASIGYSSICASARLDPPDINRRRNPVVVEGELFLFSCLLVVLIAETTAVLLLPFPPAADDTSEDITSHNNNNSSAAARHRRRK